MRAIVASHCTQFRRLWQCGAGRAKCRDKRGTGTTGSPIDPQANRVGKGGDTQSMQLGFFTMPIHPVGKDWRQSLREDREAFILADELGFVEGYVGEHVTDAAENITSCTTFIATLVDATRRIRLGNGTVNMPNNHSDAVAGNVAVLDLVVE